MQKERSNLSDNRGNKAGIGFFKCCMTLFGQRFCAFFVYFVAAFYALFDSKAFRSAKPYLQGRFPGVGGLALRWHFYRMAVSQGQVLVLAHWLRTGHSVPIVEHDKEILHKMLTDTANGLILLISHAGCWQAALTYLETFGRRVNLLLQINKNASIAEMFKGKLFNVIDNDAPFGGLLECVSAIENGEIVCIMGDRQPSDVEESIRMIFNGNELNVPVSPWLLAARCKCPIVPIFTMMTGLATGIDFYFTRPIEIQYDIPKKPKPEHFSEYVRQYSMTLERMAQAYPYQIFHYKNN